MADEDQERFEDYVELERYIEELQAGKNAQPPVDLTPEQASIYQMAALFRSASPENAKPRLAFAEQLKAQLLNARENLPEAVRAPEITPQESSTSIIPTISSSEPVPVSIKKTGITKPVRFFSRRGLLTSGAVAAASLVIGAGTTHLLDQKTASHDNNTIATISASTHLEISTSIATSWHFVTTVAALGNGAVRFTTDTLVGYVLHVSDRAQAEQIIALSAACTHMGCIVRWDETDRNFHCPCHTALFAEDGTHIRLDYTFALSPLPRLNTKIEDGKVYVEVPR